MTEHAARMLGPSNFFALFCLLQCTEASRGICPKGFSEHQHGCYHVSTQEGNISECQHKICASLNSTLATICDKSLHSFLARLAFVGAHGTDVTEESNALLPAWIGLFERGEDESGDWVWSDGRKCNYSHWAPGEPNNWCLDEDCATIGLLGGTLGKPGRMAGWYDLACTERRRCICQYSRNPVISNDFLQKEADLINVSGQGSYEQCLVKTEKCWWYENNTFQYSVFVIGVPCLLVVIYAIAATISISFDLGFGIFDVGAGTRGDSSRECIGLSSVSSLYGGLLGGPDSASFKTDSFVHRWVVRGATAEILYAVALFLLALSTFLHMNRGISFGFGIDALEASLMFICKMAVATSAVFVHWKLSPVSRAVVRWWVLVLAASKTFLGICTLILAFGYVMATMEGGIGSLCMWGYYFCWTLLMSLVFECSSAFALCRLQQRAVAHAGDARIFSRVIGCSWLLLVSGTLGSGLGLGIVAVLFVFDDPHDRFSPYRAFGFFYMGAALCQFMAGIAMLRANKQIRHYFASAFSTVPATEGFDTSLELPARIRGDQLEADNSESTGYATADVSFSWCSFTRINQEVARSSA